MKIICISGKARHGKDTLANILKDSLEDKGQRVLIAHFGDLLKYICATFFEWDGKKDEQGRALLQYVGTNVIRNREPDFWINFIITVLSFFMDEWDYVLIPDCRFPNEFERFKEQGFEAYLVRIERPKCESGLTEEQLHHPSETAMDKYPADCYVINESDLEHLRKQALSVLKFIGD